LGAFNKFEEIFAKRLYSSNFSKTIAGLLSKSLIFEGPSPTFPAFHKKNYFLLIDKLTTATKTGASA